MGCWQSSTRSLRISEHLIRSYPWSTTLQVLKHEMAHQYCEEVSCDNDSAHGESFQRACILLGVLPVYRGAQVISEALLRDIAEGEGGRGKSCKILSKIEKLLALGESSNSHEAEVALQKASLLIDKYQVDQLTVGDHENYTVTVVETGRKQVATYRRYICNILQEFFYVRVVLAEAYVPLTNGTQKTIELLGTAENVAIAEYCFHFLENQLEILWKQFHLATGKKGRTQKNSYYLGVVLGFYQKLKIQSAAATAVTSQQKELLVVEDTRLGLFVQNQFPRLQKSSARSSRVDRDSYQQGMTEGQRLSLKGGVERDKTSPQKYLE